MIKENIYTLRRKKGLTQAELADMVDVSVQSVRNWEAGTVTPKGIRLASLADALGVSQEELTGKHFSKTRIPVLGHIPAGIPIEAIQDVLDWEDIPASWTGEYFALVVHGDSMYPRYQDGDRVIVRHQSSFDSGEDCVVLVNGFDATLKTVIHRDNGIELKPYNEAYKPMFFTDNVQILGVVVELRRRMF